VTVGFEPGTVFAGYRVESLVARGGMGVVYRAVDLRLERPVALKLIAPELAADEHFRVRFLRESRLAASLDHANVVPIYEAGEHEGQLYLAMRFVEGSDLKTLLPRHGALGPERSLPILAQVAHALDAAHRRALVHRDVKPGNVMIDEDGHAYLTDFGVTKRIGGDTTDTGHMVGTLDYLAPEQIRGDPIDGRTDEYALACVLYECLAGLPPFRRETEGEALWAHMQDDFAPLRDHPQLDPVLRKGLAKDRDNRYATCTELIDDATRALGLASRPARHRRVPAGLVRHRRAILAAGALVLAATVGAATAIVMTGKDADEPPAGNGVAAIALDGDRVSSFTEAQTAPSNLAVGEGAVWVLNTEDRTISRIDPKTGRVVKTFTHSLRPRDITATSGALWVSNADEETGLGRYSVSRIDPGSGRVLRTVRLPQENDNGGWEASGHPMIVAGAGGIWTGNPEGTISRLDPKTGDVVATSETYARRIAAGREGVWVVGIAGNDLWGIDPRTNRTTRHVRLGAYALQSVAVGAGSVWAVAAEGTLWRVDPQPPHVTDAIDVGAGTEYVAFADGQVWTGNFVDGTVSRIDPRTNTVVAKVPVGASQALAAGAGSAWISVAGGERDGVLPAFTCSAVSSGGLKPDVLIASDFPLQNRFSGDLRPLAAAIEFVLKDHSYRAGRFTVGYQSCDNSTAQSGEMERRKCAANANAFARADDVVAVIGPFETRCARVEVPILNQAPGGPLAIVSPSNTIAGITRGGRLATPPPDGLRNEPDVYYPTGERNYARVVGREDHAGVALAILSRRLGLKNVYVAYGDAGGDVSWTDPFRRAAAKLGVEIAGVKVLADESNFRAFAGTIARSGADGVMIGSARGSGTALVKAVRARLGKRITIMSADAFADDVPDVLAQAGPAARGLYLATPQLPADGADLTPAASRFVAEFGTAAHERYVLQTAQAAEVVLQAIGRSDGTRASVLQELRATRVKDGLLGSFGFDRHGDMTPSKVTILRITGATPPSLHLPDEFEGAVVDSIITVPAELSG
jgi:YVTN family beta-propeller protein